MNYLLEVFRFGGTFAWIAFGTITFTVIIQAFLIKHPLTFPLIKPLSVMAMVCAIYTIFNGLAYVELWDVGSYFDSLSTYTTENPEQVGKQVGRSRGRQGIALIIIGIWPYFSIVIGAITGIAYYLIFKNPSSFRHYEES